MQHIMYLSRQSRKRMVRARSALTYLVSVVLLYAIYLHFFHYPGSEINLHSKACDLIG